MMPGALRLSAASNPSRVSTVSIENLSPDSSNVCWISTTLGSLSSTRRMHSSSAAVFGRAFLGRTGCRSTTSVSSTAPRGPSASVCSVFMPALDDIGFMHLERAEVGSGGSQPEGMAFIGPRELGIQPAKLAVRQRRNGRLLFKVYCHDGLR